MSSTGLIALVIYGDVKSLSLSPVYRTHEKQGKRTLEPCILYSIRHKRLDARVHRWDPRYRLHACRQECTAVLPAAWRTPQARCGVHPKIPSCRHNGSLHVSIWDMNVQNELARLPQAGRGRRHTCNTSDLNCNNLQI